MAYYDPFNAGQYNTLNVYITIYNPSDHDFLGLRNWVQAESIHESLRWMDRIGLNQLGWTAVD